MTGCDACNSSPMITPAATRRSGAIKKAARARGGLCGIEKVGGLVYSPSPVWLNVHIDGPVFSPND
jgi:hypothetical protein